MPRRLNRIVEKLGRGQLVFGGAFLRNGNIDDATTFADLGYDFVVVDMEHEGFDLFNLRITLQFLLSRSGAGVEAATPSPPAPLVRIPPNGRERNQWIFKQVLDTGAFGLIVPQVETVDDAAAAVIASRYPRASGEPASDVVGERGVWMRLAPRYWGVPHPEYFRVADLWPLNPDGEVLLMPIIETAIGVRNLDQILRDVKGIGAIWAGSGDLSVSLGHPLDINNAEVEEAMQRILATCMKADVACAVFCGPAEVERRIDQGFRVIITSPALTDSGLEIGRRVAASRT